MRFMVLLDAARDAKYSEVARQSRKRANEIVRRSKSANARNRRKRLFMRASHATWCPTQQIANAQFQIRLTRSAILGRRAEGGIRLLSGRFSRVSKLAT